MNFRFATTILILITTLCSSSATNNNNVVVDNEVVKEKVSSRNLRQSRRRTLNWVKNEDTVQTRIIGGNDASPGEYPFYAKWAGCGASLVAPDVLLTAAHCQTVRDNIVFVGRSNRSNDKGIERTITKRVPHPSYNRGGVNYDYMLLKLSQPVTNIEPIQLNMNSNLPRDNQQLTVVGFGRTSAIGGTSSTLKEVNVNYITTSSCNSNSYGYNGDVKGSTMFCARASGKDACQGDSGGPSFTKNSNGSFTQLGIVSWGIGCAEARHPGVYSRISGQINWIQSTICSLTSQTNLDICRGTPQVSSSSTATTNTNPQTRPPTSPPTRPPTLAPTRPPTSPPTGYPTPAPVETIIINNGGLQDLDSSDRVSIQLEITYDQHSVETGWYFQQGGTTIAERPTGSIVTGEGTMKEIIEVTVGQTVYFTITDSYGDGNGGGYRIYGPRGQLLASSDGNFGSGETKEFTVSSSDDDGDSAISQVLLNLPIIGPEPTPAPGGNEDFLCSFLGICW